MLLCEHGKMTQLEAELFRYEYKPRSLCVEAEDDKTLVPRSLSCYWTTE